MTEQTQQPNAVAKQPTALAPIKALFERDDVKQKFSELLGKRSTAFITSVLQVAAQNQLLAKADALSIYQCAAMAATLDLPLNQNLGFAYIIPYNVKQSDGTYKVVAQFQIGYKGFIQLAQRSGQFKTIGAAPIFDGQLTECNPLTGFTFDFSKKKSDAVIGFAAHFSLLNGFEKTLYMSVDDMRQHGMRYSQTMRKGFGMWKDDFNGMGIKTVLKQLLSKFAPLSVEMQRAVVSDQATINDNETIDVTYLDNDLIEESNNGVDKETERILLMIDDASTIAELDALEPHVPAEHRAKLEGKKQRLTNHKNKK